MYRGRYYLVLRRAQQSHLVSTCCTATTTRVKQQLWCPHDERVVERSEIVKGYEYRKGEYVIIEPEEIKKLSPKLRRRWRSLEFVEYKEVIHLLQSSYYLVPDEAGRRPYALLTRAMEETGYVAIAKLTMHNREYTGVSGGLMRRTDAAHHLLTAMKYASWRASDQSTLH